MEAIIKTSDRYVFDSLLNFLESIHITVETKGEKSPKTVTQKWLNIPSYKCKGKVSDFEREDLYGSRL